ncbi:MAG: hypothetical protein H0W86_10925 [Armatimonadetes bacterium]|nr:hypothetical protein [Armatimonadota bacterium]
MPYAVTFTALSSAAVSLSLLLGSSLTGINVWDWLSAGSSFLIGVASTVYRRNGGSEGKHFLQRMLVIGWVVSLRCLVTFLAIAFLLAAVLGWGEESDHTTWYEVFLIAVAEAFVYWRIGHHVRDLATWAAAE